MTSQRAFYVGILCGICLLLLLGLLACTFEPEQDFPTTTTTLRWNR